METCAAIIRRLGHFYTEPRIGGDSVRAWSFRGSLLAEMASGHRELEEKTLNDRGPPVRGPTLTDGKVVCPRRRKVSFEADIIRIGNFASVRCWALLLGCIRLEVISGRQMCAGI